MDTTTSLKRVYLISNQAMSMLMPVTKTNYQQRLQPVIRYLESHFKESLNLKQVAEKAFLSPYHFHRLFKAITHETPADFLRRLKLEHAAHQLFYNNQSTTELALSLGFSSSQSFAKAFRRYFGISATDIRHCLNQEQYRLLIHHSKIGHLLRNPGNVNLQKSTYACPCTQQQGTAMKIESIKHKSLAYIRVTGPYGQDYQAAQQRLHQWATLHALTEGDSIYIYHDNPEITPEEKCRTDICITVPVGTKVPKDIELKTLPAGNYASLRRTISNKAQYAQSWNELMEQIVNAQLTLDERPCFEFYHHFDVDNNIADVSFYTAVNLS